MKKKIISAFMALCLVVAMVGVFPARAEASILSFVLGVSKSAINGCIDTVKNVDHYDNNYGKAMLGMLRNMAADFTGLNIGEDYGDGEGEGGGSTTPSEPDIYIQNVDLSGVEAELRTINTTLEQNTASIHQLESTVTKEMQSISEEIEALSKQIKDQTKQLKYSTYLNSFFDFFNQYLEGLSYYDAQMADVLTEGASDAYVKNTFDQFYHLENVEYSGSLHSSVDKLGRYLRGEYLSSDPGGVVDILSQYYILGYKDQGFTEEVARQKAAADTESMISYILYAYSMGVYYEQAIATYQTFYMEDNGVAEYRTDFGTVISKNSLEKQFIKLASTVQETSGCILIALLDNYEPETVDYTRYSGTWSGTYTADVDGFDVILDDSFVTTTVNGAYALLYIPDACNFISSDFSDEFRHAFAGITNYEPQESTAEGLTLLTGDSDCTALKFRSIGDYKLDIKAGDRVLRTIPITVHDQIRTHIPQLDGSTYTGLSIRGDGSENFPFEVFNEENDVKYMLEHPDKHYILREDINLNGATLKPASNFSGRLDGNGYTISNFKIDTGAPSAAISNYRAVGLFGVVTGTVSNLQLSNVTITNGSTAISSDKTVAVGAIAGVVCGGRIEYCTLKDINIDITGNTASFVGGVAGRLEGNGSIFGTDITINRTIDCTVSNNNSACVVGGIVGSIGSQSGISIGGKAISAESNKGTVSASQAYVVRSELMSSNKANSGDIGVLAGAVERGELSRSISIYTGIFYRIKSYSTPRYGDIAGSYNRTNGLIQNVGYCPLGTNVGLRVWRESTLPGAEFAITATALYDNVMKGGENEVTPLIYKEGSTSLVMDRRVCALGDYPKNVKGDVYGDANKHFDLSGMALYYCIGENNPIAPVKHAVFNDGTDDYGYAQYRQLVNGRRFADNTTIVQDIKFHIYEKESDPNYIVELQLTMTREHTYFNNHRAPKCTGPGCDEYRCVVCRDYKGKTLIDALPHTEVIDPAVPATCSSAGKTEGKHCSVCGNVTEQQQATSMLEHNHTIVEGYAPTCQKEGLTDKDYCSVCGFVNSEAKPIETIGHTMVAHTVIEPSCTTAGMSQEKCSVCGAYGDFKSIAPVGHDYVASAVNSTCGELGYTVYTCSHCGDTYTGNFADTICPSAYFTDVPDRGHWSHDGIDYMLRLGLFVGMSDTTFEPETAVTRGMLVTVLYRYEGEPKVTAENVFSDVPDNEWYADAVVWAAEEGIAYGVGENLFDPNGEITREQMATFLYRYAELKKYDVTTLGDYSDLPDADTVSEWAEDALRWAYGAGLIQGTTIDKVTYLDPQGNATRAQACAILMRYIENIEK